MSLLLMRWRAPVLAALALLVLVLHVRPLPAQQVDLKPAIDAAMAAQKPGGDLDGALQKCREAERASQGREDKQRAWLLNELGQVLRLKGRYEEARLRYEQSRDLYKRLEGVGPQHPFVANVSINLGLLHVRARQYRDAEKAYLESLEIRKGKFGATAPEAAEVQLYLAEVDRLLGRRDEARKKALGSLQIFRNARRPEIDALMELGAIEQADGNNNEARGYYEQALRALEARKSTAADSLQGICEIDLGWALFGLGDVGGARGHFDKGLDILKERYGVNHPMVARALCNVGMVHHTVGQYAQAEPLYRKGLEIRLKMLPPDNPDVMLSRYNLALVLGSEGQWEEAGQEMDRARQSLGRYLTGVLPYLRDDEMLDFLQTEREQLHAALSLGLAHREDPKTVARSAEWLVNSKGISQEVLAKRTILSRDSKDARLAELLDAQTKIANLTLSDATEGGDLARLQDHARELSRGLGDVLAREMGPRPWVTLEQVRNQLPRDGVLIEIAKFDRWDFQARQKQQPGQALRYAAWVIPAQGAVTIVDLGEAGRLDKAIADVRQQLHDIARKYTKNEFDERASEPELRGVLSRLGDLLLQPLAARIDRTKRWIISPDSDLWFVSWAMLPVKGGGYVVQDHTISYLVSSRDLLTQPVPVQRSAPLIMADPDYDLSPADANKLAAGILSRRPPGMAVVQSRPSGNPNFAVRGDSGAGLAGLDEFERLKGTASEAEKSRQKFRQLANQEPSVFLQQQALEKVFKAALSPRFVFLGTHGFALSSRKNKRDNPLAVCGLALAGANKHAGARGDEDDGILTGLEIIGTDLRGTELVVLSACDTGLGKAADGEGVLGLRQAFQLAGAQTVIATLWSVPDNPKLVEDYLTGLADGADRAEALQKAQVALLEYRRKRYGDTHPFYWAAFTATGEVKKLSP